ncbi:MAG: Rieske 2Fe-2S domain-containing protein [Chloroflexi bacterium]|nr:Rieske 2Fe-2S domain-containing protein [Chloroflexota bacterium]
MTTAISKRMINLGPVAAVPLGEGLTYRVGPLNIAIFRPRTGEVYATQAACPHRGGPLADGIVGGGKVICPLHNFRFELATGMPINGECAALQTYPVSVNEADELVLTLEC